MLCLTLLSREVMRALRQTFSRHSEFTSSGPAGLPGSSNCGDNNNRDSLLVLSAVLEEAREPGPMDSYFVEDTCRNYFQPHVEHPWALPEILKGKESVKG